MTMLLMRLLVNLKKEKKSFTTWPTSSLMHSMTYLKNANDVNWAVLSWRHTVVSLPCTISGSAVICFKESDLVVTQPGRTSRRLNMVISSVVISTLLKSQTLEGERERERERERDGRGDV
ncbi:hypothetical protein MTR_0061s0080 [Medicago truncatula]|uniref:Uncharacterized protein n=1 Tax=Medicago truncatula TaxID=3880 RepID=G7ZXR3_MEDTR|nr:hypothetical protein MTR_0061s0080 [Medicago truncatula]